MWYIFVIVKPINRGTFTSPGGKGGGKNVDKYKRGGRKINLKRNTMSIFLNLSPRIFFLGVLQGNIVGYSDIMVFLFSLYILYNVYY